LGTMDKGQLAPWAVLVVLPLAAAATVGSTLSLAPQLDELGPVAPHKRVPLCSPDAVLLEAHLGPNATAHLMRHRLKKMGVTPSLRATAAVLQRDLAASLRAQATLPPASNTLSNVSALRLALEQKGEVFSASEQAPELIEKLESRLERECFVINTQRPLAASLALEDLQQATAERMLTSTGSQRELISRLYTFQRHCDKMTDAINGFSCTNSKLDDALGARGLSKMGSKEEKMARLTEAVDAGKMAAAASGGRCDIVAQGPICVEGGKKVLAADASPRGMLAHFTFDDAHGLDTSGSHNHASKPPTFGPGVGGKGHSARYVGAQDYTEINHHAGYAEARDTFSVSMWMYLRQDSTGDWRTLMHKGSTDSDRTPTLFLEPITRGLEFFVSTTDANQPDGERLWSNSFVPLNRWTHITAVAEGHSLRLYINGLLDSENATVGTIVHNTGPLYLGGDPWRKGSMDGFVDEFKMYSRALTLDEIQAEASHALGGVEPSFVELGCMACDAEAAARSCRLNYHPCNTRDLYAGGYVTARTMGWATSSSYVWSKEDLDSGGVQATSWSGEAQGVTRSGLGLCCADNE